MNLHQEIVSLIESTFVLAAPSGIGAQTRLSEIPGWDSMTSVSLEVALESAYGIKAGDIELADTLTVAELAEQVRAKRTRA